MNILRNLLFCYQYMLFDNGSRLARASNFPTFFSVASSHRASRSGCRIKSSHLSSRLHLSSRRTSLTDDFKNQGCRIAGLKLFFNLCTSIKVVGGIFSRLRNAPPTWLRSFLHLTPWSKRSYNLFNLVLNCQTRRQLFPRENFQLFKPFIHFIDSLLWFGSSSATTT